MDKIAIFKGKEIARERAINPKIGNKFNTEELMEFFNRIGNTIKFDNNKQMEFYVRYTITE